MTDNASDYFNSLPFEMREKLAPAFSETRVNTLRRVREIFDSHHRAALTAAGEMAREKQGCKMAWKQGFCYGDPEYYPPSPVGEDTRITELQAQLAEAREALKPFADAYVNREKWAEDSYIGGSDLRNRDLRRAARALETTKPRI